MPFVPPVLLSGSLFFAGWGAALLSCLIACMFFFAEGEPNRNLEAPGNYPEYSQAAEIKSPISSDSLEEKLSVIRHFKRTNAGFNRESRHSKGWKIYQILKGLTATDAGSGTRIRCYCILLPNLVVYSYYK